MRLLVIVFFVLCAIGLLCPESTQGQTVVGMGTNSPNPNAVLELVSNTQDQGFLVPRFTTAQRTSSSFISKLSTKDNGLLVFDTNEGNFYYWFNSTWLLGTGGNTAVATVWYSGDELPDNAIGQNNDFYIQNKTGDLYRKSEDVFNLIGNIKKEQIQFTAGNGIQISPNNEIINTGDLDTSNEIQDLQLSGDLLKITNNSNASEINLAPYKNNDTNELIQGVELSGETLRITDAGGNHDVDLSYFDDDDKDPANELQKLKLSDHQLQITGNSESEVIDLSPYLDNTDNQTLSLTDTDLSITNGNTISLGALKDGTGTDDQNLSSSKTGNNVTISIEDGNSASFDVTDDDNDPENEIQDLSLTSHELKITGNVAPTAIDLSPYLDNTDDQKLSSSKTGNNVTISIEDGNSASFDVADGDNDAENEIQDLSLSSHKLEITGNATPTAIDLSPYLDNTDSQKLSSGKAGNYVTISIENGNNTSFDVADNDNDAENEIQDLSLSSHKLEITGNTTPTAIDLSPYLDNTDNQNLSNSKTGNNVTINIEDGSSTTFSIDDADSNANNEIITSTTLEPGNVLRITEAGVNHDVNLNSLKEVSLPNNNILVGNASNIAAPVTVKGDITLNSDGTMTIQLDAVTTAKILDDAVTKTKIHADVAGDGLGQNADGSLEINPGHGMQLVSDQLSLTNTADGKILIGDGTTINSKSVTGDANLANSGTLTVSGLQGRTVSNTAPTTGDVLIWNGSSWEPQPTSSGSGASWFSGSFFPSIIYPLTAINGDYYYRTSTETVYRKVSGLWQEQGKWVKQSGSTVDGAVISQVTTPTLYIGTGKPNNGANNNGIPGDLYYDSDKDEVWIKKDSTDWHKL